LLAMINCILFFLGARQNNSAVASGQMGIIISNSNR
jgi:hypothetical protein